MGSTVALIFPISKKTPILSHFKSCPILIVNNLAAITHWHYRHFGVHASVPWQATWWVLLEQLHPWNHKPEPVLLSWTFRRASAPVRTAIPPSAVGASAAWDGNRLQSQSQDLSNPIPLFANGQNLSTGFGRIKYRARDRIWIRIQKYSATLARGHRQKETDRKRLQKRNFGQEERKADRARRFKTPKFLTTRSSGQENRYPIGNPCFCRFPLYVGCLGIRFFGDPNQ